MSRYVRNIQLLCGFAGLVALSSCEGNSRGKEVQPGGVWVTPENGALVTGLLTMAANAYPTESGDPAIDYVNFTYNWEGRNSSIWKVCRDDDPDPVDINYYECSVTLPLSEELVPPGEIQVSFDVYDINGNVQYSPEGGRTVIYDPESASQQPREINSLNEIPENLSGLEIKTMYLIPGTEEGTKKVIFNRVDYSETNEDWVGWTLRFKMTEEPLDEIPTNPEEVSDDMFTIVKEHPAAQYLPNDAPVIYTDKLEPGTYLLLMEVRPPGENTSWDQNENSEVEKHYTLLTIEK